MGQREYQLGLIFDKIVNRLMNIFLCTVLILAILLLASIPIAIYKDTYQTPIKYNLSACNAVSKCEVYGTFNQLTTCESMKKQLSLETKMNFYECEKAVK